MLIKNVKCLQNIKWKIIDSLILVFHILVLVYDIYCLKLNIDMCENIYALYT